MNPYTISNWTQLSTKLMTMATICLIFTILQFLVPYPESWWPLWWTSAASSFQCSPAHSRLPWHPPWVWRRTMGPYPCRSIGGDHQSWDWPRLLSAPWEEGAKCWYLKKKNDIVSLNLSATIIEHTLYTCIKSRWKMHHSNLHLGTYMHLSWADL